MCSCYSRYKTDWRFNTLIIYFIRKQRTQRKQYQAVKDFDEIDGVLNVDDAHEQTSDNKETD